MKTRYEAEDGQLFDSAQECKLHEEAIKLTQEIYDTPGIYVTRQIAETIAKYLVTKYAIFELSAIKEVKENETSDGALYAATSDPALVVEANSAISASLAPILSTQE